MSLLWRQVEISTTLPVEEVQGRLATAMGEWGGYFQGCSPPPPPWPDGRFTACPGWRLRTRLAPVVEGTVRAEGGATRLTAFIRPHGLDVASAFILTAAVLVAVASGAPPVALVVLGLLWPLWALGVSLWLRRRAPALQEVLAAACAASAPHTSDP